jgi:hypothetical protein
MSSDNLLALADYSGADVEWISTGHGRPPQQGGNAPQRPPEPRSGPGGTGIAPRPPMHRSRALRVAAAVEHAILRNEVYGTETGREFLIRELTLFANDLANHDCDNRDIIAVLTALVKGEL